VDGLVLRARIGRAVPGRVDDVPQDQVQVTGCDNQTPVDFFELGVDLKEAGKWIIGAEIAIDVEECMKFTSSDNSDDVSGRDCS